MQKRLFFMIMGIVVVGVGVGVYRWYAKQPATVPVSLIRMKSTRSIERAAGYAFTVDLPAIDGLQDAEEQRRMNADMRTPILATMDRLRAAVAERGTGGASYRYESSFTVESFTDRILSLTFTHAEYTGGVHPASSVTTYTYDFLRHKRVTIEDLFRGLPEDYLPTLSRLAKEDLVRGLDLDRPDADRHSVTWVARGTAPAIAHFATFHLMDDAIVFHFMPTTVAPSAEGVRTVTIPYTSLRAYIKPGSVIAAYR